ncbi:MAG: SpoIIE family protein phosphatase [Gammaproteobacteria bacterium]
MGTFEKNSIATQLSVWFLLVALLPLALVTYMTYRSSEKSLIKEVTNSLVAIGQRQSNQIETYLRERERSITALAHSTAMGDAMEKLVFHAKGSNSVQYADVEREFGPFAAYYQEASGYEDLYLIALEGNIAFSTKRGRIFGINLRRGPYRDSELTKVFQRSLMSMATELSDFAYYEAADKPVAFIATPLFKNEFLVGIAAVEMNNEEVYKLVNDYTGLGGTGEMVVASKVGDKAVFITPIRHDPDAAFSRTVPIGGKWAVDVQEAVQGRKGSGILTDYRGKEVLAIWRYLPYLRWGMVVKIDTEEAFAPIARLRILSSIIGTLTLLLVVLVAVFVARSFSYPIVRLTEITRSIAGGDLTQRIIIPAKNEIGILAASFNEMTRQLKESINNLKETTAAKGRIESELKIAHDIQMSMVPKVFPPFPNRCEFDIYATIVPATEVGGDFYDFFFIDENHLCLAIGDVSGKGVPAALSMAVTKTLFKASAGIVSSPDGILFRLNQESCRDNESCTFVTVFCAVLDVRTGRLEYSNAGHNLPYLICPNGIKPLEKTGGIALGVMEEARYHARGIVLKPGSGLFLYTDGVTEAMDGAGNLFSQHRLEHFLERVKGFSPTQIIQGAVAEVGDFSAGVPQSDDITLLALRYLGARGIEYSTGNKISVALKSELSELEKLAQIVAEFGQRHHLSSEVLFHTTVALEEIVSNVIAYAYDDRGVHKIIVCLLMEQGELTVEVEDDGRPFNPLETLEPDMQKPLEERPVGGLGIHLVRNLMDRLEYRRQDGRNRLIMMKKVIEA